MLMDHADPGGAGIARTANGQALALQANLAFIGQVDPGEDVHQGRLAGAVLAQQRVYLAALQLQADAVEHRALAEALAQPAQFQEHRGRGRRHGCHLTLPTVPLTR